MKRPHTLDPTIAMLTDMRDDAFPPTNVGIAQAVLSCVRHVETAACATVSVNRAVLWVTLKRPWWSWLAIGFAGRCRRKIRRLINRYGAPGVTFEIRID